LFRVGGDREGVEKECVLEVLEEFFAITLRERFYDALEPLQTALDAWLIHYNRERPHRGYRNLDKRPIDTVNAYLSTVRQEA
ncbi:MAG: integrase core domain-containing protein, partial [Gemmatimonadaceae bacterium]|nr:integrase core domain-containing protein [Gemmatimonadaceae bacterium]